MMVRGAPTLDSCVCADLGLTPGIPELTCEEDIRWLREKLMVRHPCELAGRAPRDHCALLYADSRRPVRVRTWQMHATDEEAAAKFRELVTESLNTKRTRFNDACHLLRHG